MMFIKTAVTKVRSLWACVEKQLDCIAPVADLVARLYIAKVFFSSGLNKIQGWDDALYLFREEYHVPFLPPEVAAVMGTAGELGFSVLLAVGLFTRFAACGLFFMNIMAVISYYDSLKDSPAALQDHLEWGILLVVLLTTQIRQLTLDHLIKQKFYLQSQFT
jgi:putative oxidoreductase